MSGQSDDRCDVCKYTGLAVLPALYAVVPSRFNAPGLGPFTGERVTSQTLSQSKYALRQLRQGFLYLFYEQGKHGKNYWEVYSVAQDGTLWKQLDPAGASSVGTPPSCSRKAHNALRTRYLVIERPDQCTTVWLAFSEHKWSKSTIAQYGDSAARRMQRMQAIHPGAWMSAPSAAHHQAPLTEANLQHVVEYSPLVQTGKNGEPLDLPNSLLPGPLSDNGNKGACILAKLEACGTLYPWTMRNQAAPGAKHSPAAQLAELAKASTINHGKQGQPMMLALWDAIGMAHELNGFRNDANARFVQYADEQAIRIDALQNIDEARKAVEAGARRVATFDNSAAVPGSTGYYNPDAVAKQLAAAKTPQEQQFWSDYQWMGQNGVPQSYATRITQLRSFPNSQPYQEAMSEARQYVAAKPRMQQNQDNRIDQETDERSRHDWTKYQKKLAPDTPGQAAPLKVDVFRGLYDKAQERAQELQALRTPDLAAWLDAKLLLDTLEDYHDQELLDGLAYEMVIAKAIIGLNSEKQGDALIDKLVDRLHPTKPESILWRAVARNHKQTRLALEQMLQAAQKHKETLLDKAGEGFNVFAETTEQVKKFVEFYEKMEALSKQVKPVSGGDKVLRDAGVDVMVTTAGQSIFKKFRMEELGDYVGEGVIQSLFLSRAGFNVEDVRKLVIKQAMVQPALRRQFLAEVQRQLATGLTRTKAFIAASYAVSKTEGSKVLKEQWKDLGGEEEGQEVRGSIGVATLIGLIELVGFFKILKKKDKEGRDYVELGGAAMSVAAAVAQVAIKPSEAMKLVRTAENFKVLAGYLSGVAAGIGASLDLVDAAEASAKRERLLAGLYLFKSFLGFASAGTYLFTALSASTPLLERVAGKVVGNEVKFVILERIGQGIADAAARKAAIAAGEEAATIAAERVGMMALGRLFLFVASWEVQVGIIGVQILIWWFKPDGLQDAISASFFGIAPKVRSNDGVKKQDEMFEKALVSVGLKVENDHKQPAE